MNITAQRLLALIVVAAGLLTACGYAAVIALSGDRNEAGEQLGALAGFALFGAAVGCFWLFATFRIQGAPGGTLRLPPAWLSALIFIAFTGAGFGLAAVDRALYLAPLLTILGFTAVGAFFLRLAATWMPKRRLPLRNLVLPGIWGVFVAPLILMVVQGAAVVVFVIAAVAGILAENPDFEVDPNLEDRVTAYFEESGTDATSTELPEIVAESPTIALTLFSVVAIMAPLSEELVKAFGAILVLTRLPVVTRADALFAAVGSSLGFALFEGVGYTLGAGAAWHQLMLVRAPVVVMHIAATAIIVIGWHRMRATGRGFIPYFAAGTALHAGWNALYVGFIYSLTGLESGSDPSAGQALGIMAMVLLLGALFIAGLAWFLGAAHKAGIDERHDPATVEQTYQAETSYAASG